MQYDIMKSEGISTIVAQYGSTGTGTGTSTATF